TARRRGRVRRRLSRTDRRSSSRDPRHHRGRGGQRRGRAQHLWDGAGAAIWAGSSLAIGVIFHDAIDRSLNALAELGTQAVVLLASILALFVLFKWWERRRFFQFLRMARITPEALRERMASGPPVVVLDVRSAAAQAADPGRIPGALMLDPDDLEARLKDVSPHEEIVLYCT
ncbi:MAG: hypothetical protein LC732_04130, partial [Acidobacteria bacterium]|nr:hypothetical protein [Acidobacteriota bacterium]